MQLQEQQSILTIALLAAFVDGAKDDSEREEIKRLADTLSNEAGAPSLPAIYQDVLLKRVDVTKAAAALTDPGHKQLAYEMAVCVCDADGVQTPVEHRFLEQLKAALGLSAAATAEVEREADALAAEPLPPPSRSGGVPAAAPSSADDGRLPSGGQVATVNEAELDKSILNASILNGALELLPQSWASLAIIPLQVRMCYRIGQAHGVQLDQGHIKEFIAAAGVGLTSQYLEQFGRKLLGGLFGKVGGGLGRGLGSAATGMAFSFASTYALGQLAKRYYAGGRRMDTAVLKDAYQALLGPAKQMQAQYLPAIQERARTVDVSQVMGLVRGA